MLIVETIRKIRLAYHRDEKPIRQIARELRLSKNSVKKVIRSVATEFEYERSFQPRPKLGPFEERLSQLLSEDRDRPPRERRSAQVLFEELLFDPVACTPAAAWEKGQVEKQVDFLRGRLFIPRRKFTDLEELNRYLADHHRTLAAGQKHPEFPEKTVAEVFAEERKHLLTVRVPFDGYRETLARVSPTLLVSFDRNRYSVHPSAVGMTATVRSYARQVVIVADDKVVGVHDRQFGRDKTLFDPWHYVEALKYKPGGLRNGAPFKEWELPEPLQEVRAALSVHPDGDRQFVGILWAVLAHGLEGVTDACAAALAAGTVSRDVVLNILSRDNEASEPSSCDLPSQLPPLRLPPVADCGRYDRLLAGGSHVA